LQLKEIYTYLLLHKPRGCITTASDERGRKTVLDLLPAELKKKRLFPVGRLDKDTTGLLLLTDDGELAHTLMHPGSQVEKTYEVGISAPFRKEHLARFTKGIRDEDDLLKAKEVRILEDRLLEVVLTEGKKREIKRMFAKLGYTLTFIKRIQYSFLSLRDLEEGKFRALSQKEVAKLKAKDGVRS
jgi:pseudouridine synthase